MGLLRKEAEVSEMAIIGFTTIPKKREQQIINSQIYILWNGCLLESWYSFSC